MVWIYILIFIPLITASRRRDEPSYRSNVMSGNKPIFLLSAKAKDYSESDSGEYRQTGPTPKTKVPAWARKVFLRWLSSLLPFEVQNTPEPYYSMPEYYPPVLRYHGEDRQTNQLSNMKVPEWAERRFFDWFYDLWITFPKPGQEDLAPPVRLRSKDEDRQTSSPSNMKVPVWPERRFIHWLYNLWITFPTPGPENPAAPPRTLRFSGFNEDDELVLGIPSKDDDNLDPSEDGQTSPPPEMKEPVWAERRFIHWLYNLWITLPKPGPENPAAPPRRLRSRGEGGQTSPPPEMKEPLWAERRFIHWLHNLWITIPTPSPENPAAPPIWLRSLGEDGQTSPSPKMIEPVWPERRFIHWLYNLWITLPKPGPENPAAPPRRLRSRGEDGQTSPPPKMIEPVWAERRFIHWLYNLWITLPKPGPENPAAPPRRLRSRDDTVDPFHFFTWLFSLLPELPRPSPLHPAVPPIKLRSNGHNKYDKLVLRTPSKDTEDFDSSFNEDDKLVLRIPSKDDDNCDSKSSLRTKTKRTKHKQKNKKKHKEQKKPDWVTDLKDFVKDLTNHYGLEEVLQRSKPVIRSIEKKQHVKVTDIDVDEYGEIHITFIDTKKKKKKFAREGTNIADET